MVKETTISAGGRIVIPKEMRDQLHLRHGETVIVRRKGKTIIIKPKDVSEHPVAELYGAVPASSEQPKQEARAWMKRQLDDDL